LGDGAAPYAQARPLGPLTNGPEVIKYQDQVFLIIVSIQDPVPQKLRKMFDIGPLEPVRRRRREAKIRD
jgi:hypothetical protein